MKKILIPNHDNVIASPSPCLYSDWGRCLIYVIARSVFQRRSPSTLLRMVSKGNAPNHNLSRWEEIASSRLNCGGTRNDSKMSHVTQSDCSGVRNDIRIFCFTMLVIATLILPHASWGFWDSSTVHQGNQLYEQQKYDEALRKYNHVLERKADACAVNFNAGSALYKKREYDKAISHFEKSLLCEDPKLQAKGYYNLGNAKFLSGKQQEAKDIDQAIKSMEEALSHYVKAGNLDAKDPDPPHNAAIVKKELDRLKEQKRKTQSEGSKGEKKNEDKGEENSAQKGQENPQASAQEKLENHDGKDTSSHSQAGKENEHGEKKESGSSAGKNEAAEQGDQAAYPTGKDSQNLPSISNQEARRMLDNYSQNEEPRGLLNLHFLRRQGTGDSPVKKDW